MARRFVTFTVLAALFTPLIGYDDKDQPYEVAAQAVSTTDNLTWTVKLKPGYTFHNGEKLTADSYLDAWNYAAYRQVLRAERARVLREAGIKRTVAEYTTAFNGFAAALTPTEVDRLQRTRGVRKVWKNEIHNVDTTTTPAFRTTPSGRTSTGRRRAPSRSGKWPACDWPGK